MKYSFQRCPSIETHSRTRARTAADLSVPDQVLGYLAVNEDRAFKAREIASQIGADEGAVSTALAIEGS